MKTDSGNLEGLFEVVFKFLFLSVQVEFILTFKPDFLLLFCLDRQEFESTLIKHGKDKTDHGEAQNGGKSPICSKTFLAGQKRRN